MPARKYVRAKPTNTVARIRTAIPEKKTLSLFLLLTISTLVRGIVAVAMRVFSWMNWDVADCCLWILHPGTRNESREFHFVLKKNSKTIWCRDLNLSWREK